LVEDCESDRSCIGSLYRYSDLSYHCCPRTNSKDGEDRNKSTPVTQNWDMECNPSSEETLFDRICPITPLKPSPNLIVANRVDSSSRSLCILTVPSFRCSHYLYGVSSSSTPGERSLGNPTSKGLDFTRRIALNTTHSHHIDRQDMMAAHQYRDQLITEDTCAT
jgi:hypothetical protein